MGIGREPNETGGNDMGCPGLGRLNTPLECIIDVPIQLATKTPTIESLIPSKAM